MDRRAVVAVVGLGALLAAGWTVPTSPIVPANMAVPWGHYVTAVQAVSARVGNDVFQQQVHYNDTLTRGCAGNEGCGSFNGAVVLDLEVGQGLHLTTWVTRFQDRLALSPLLPDCAAASALCRASVTPDQAEALALEAGLPPTGHRQVDFGQAPDGSLIWTVRAWSVRECGGKLCTSDVDRVTISAVDARVLGHDGYVQHPF